jgi:subtilisin-like proprotein convertase family protein
MTTSKFFGLKKTLAVGQSPDTALPHADQVASESAAQEPQNILATFHVAAGAATDNPASILNQFFAARSKRDDGQMLEETQATRGDLSNDFDRMGNTARAAAVSVLPVALHHSTPAKGDATAAPGGEFVHADLVVGDAYYGQQWHLNTKYGINVQAVWDEYNGRDIRIGIVDDGVQYTHKDLNNNYRTDLDYDARSKDNDAFSSLKSDRHGTTVAGVIAAEMNNDGNYGVVGVAWDADIVGFRMGFGAAGSNAQILDNMQRQKAMDISNNSWGFGGFFADNFETASFSAIGNAIRDAAANGRGGLGTVFVFAAGNERASGQNVNYHDFQNSPYTIAVGATDINGNITAFSTPGAAVLIAAPGQNVVTTDRTGNDGYVSGDFVSVSGTSFAAPIVSGVVALMLEANPLLGYRDVQEILAYAAAKPPGFLASDLVNDASNWNGGGLSYNHDYGFGLVDAHAAVRLAETWTQTSTFANQKTYTEALAPGLAIPDGNAAGISSTINVSPLELPTNILIDRIEVHLDISHTWIGDLIVALIGPDGTTSTLINRPGVSSTSVYGSSQDNIVFTTDSVHFWGETAWGNWTLSVKDMVAGDAGTLNSWSISFIGDYTSANNTYFYTDSYAAYLAENPGRGILSDGNGGIDTINLAAVTGNVAVNLNAGQTSTIAGAPLTIADGTSIENIFLGDGNDIVYGNGADNVIFGGRGADQLWGGGGNDIFDYDRMADAGDVIHDFAAGDKIDIRDVLADVGTMALWGQEPVNADGGSSANDVAIWIDPDGAGSAFGRITLVTVLNYTALTVGTDIIV